MRKRLIEQYLVLELKIKTLLELTVKYQYGKNPFYRNWYRSDVHGQDVSMAASRAVKDAIHCNSIPGIRSMLPDGDLNNMKVNVKLAIPIAIQD